MQGPDMSSLEIQDIIVHHCRCQISQRRVYASGTAKDMTVKAMSSVMFLQQDSKPDRRSPHRPLGDLASPLQDGSGALVQIV